ncbi:unnamed protein product [Adineta steineri]|uniref:Uncharacterized protein n=1 Tax=Adineta steineri TaxID=433720 RepID=A0A815QZP0_9BILA|nr:unnamed protein product [Adineta steineri]CAF3573244.1 unnamed protein product [Adineta steineri]
MNEKLTAHQNQNCFPLKRLSMCGQYTHDFKNEETSQIINIKNPLTSYNYTSHQRPLLIETSQASINHHFNPFNQQVESNSPTDSLEESTVLKFNIPIEMIVRTIPQQYIYPLNSCPTTQIPSQPFSDYISKPATSFIRKAQEVIFGNNANHDRGDILSKSTHCSDPRLINETDKMSDIQQQEKSYQPMMMQYSNSSMYSCPKRCKCNSST